MCELYVEMNYFLLFVLKDSMLKDQQDSTSKKQLTSCQGRQTSSPRLIAQIELLVPLSAQ